MEQTHELAAHTPQRKKLGLILLVSGLVSMLAFMSYIVLVRDVSFAIVLLTALCWIVFFIGKTILKTVDPPARED